MFSFSGKSKLSCALLGAAVAGAMALGATNASAELVVIYDGGVNNGNNTFTYNYTLNVNNNYTPASISSSDYFVLVGAGQDTLSGLTNWTATPITSSSSPLPTGLSYTNSDTTLTVTNGSQSSTANLLSNGSSGYLSDLLVKYSGTGTTTATPLTFSLTSSYGSLLPSSDLWYYKTGTDVGAQTVDIPAPGGTLPAGPLPLPATFWPGLGTLAAMALVGGVKLRKKFV